LEVDVLKELAVSIFRVAVCRFRNRIIYILHPQEKWSRGSRKGDSKRSQIRLTEARNSEKN
jgi:hypothetical protein